MTLSRKLSVLTVTMFLGCGPADKVDQSGAIVASGSAKVDARVDDKQVMKSFPGAGVSRVVFRAAFAREARVTSAAGHDILVTGTTRGGAPGYRAPDGQWRESAASEWGLDFRGKASGETLVISTFNEIRFIHHSYFLDQLVISVPTGVEVSLEARQLSGDGAADLAEPPVAPPPVKQ